MIWPLLIIAWFALSGVWLLYLEHKVKHEDKQARPPDLPGVFTRDEATCLIALKQRYAEMEEVQR